MACLMRASSGSVILASGGRTTAFGEVDFYVDGSPDPIAQSLSTFAVLPDGAGAFNRADQR